MQEPGRTTGSEREKRQKFLLKLLRGQAFSAQAEVVKALKKEGYEATQSSVSRDLHELEIIKAGGRYVAAGDMAQSSAQPIFQRLITGTETAGGNLLVVKTAPGAASVVADELDKFEMPGLVGTVAGDNTIFVATKNREAQGRVLRRILTRDR